jgi:hypothetical protein
MDLENAPIRSKKPFRKDLPGILFKAKLLNILLYKYIKTQQISCPGLDYFQMS